MFIARHTKEESLCTLRPFVHSVETLFVLRVDVHTHGRSFIQYIRTEVEEEEEEDAEGCRNNVAGFAAEQDRG